MTLFACALLFALAPAALAAPDALERGRGDRGGWELIWRYDEARGVRSAFESERDQGRLFPFTSRELHDTRGHRIELLDDAGHAVRVVSLRSNERAIVSEDGLAWAVLSPDSSDSRAKRIRYFRIGVGAPIWEALVGGDPILMSPDGDALVIATAFDGRDPYSRAVDTDRGRLQILGGEAGEIRGELPIFPLFSCAAGDGRKLAFLHDRELFLVGTNGKIEWKRDLPVDHLIPRSGLSPLAAGGDLVVVFGTGATSDVARHAAALHQERTGFLVVFDVGGKVVWDLEGVAQDELRFNPSCALSPDGSTLATLHDTEGEEIVTVYEAFTGKKLFERRTPRFPGARTLSVAAGGELTSLVFGDLRSTIVAWDLGGNVVFEGTIPFRSQSATIREGGLVVAEHWVLRLVD